MENNKCDSQKKKKIYIYIELPYDPAIIHMDIYAKAFKEQAQINICTHVLSSIIHNIQKWQEAKYSSMDK